MTIPAQPTQILAFIILPISILMMNYEYSIINKTANYAFRFLACPPKNIAIHIYSRFPVYMMFTRKNSFISPNGGTRFIAKNFAAF
tara:strand:+ start:231 stop:488 length:258 start_codon:yes stop_codon:yes gene_type:complete